MNLKELIKKRTETYRDKTFIVYQDEEITYTQMNNLSNRVANAFLDMGIRKGDKVAIMLPNCPEFLYVWFGLAKIGAVEVLVNTQMRGALLKHQFTMGDSQLAVIGTEFLETFLEIAEELLHLKTILFVPGKKNHEMPEGLCSLSWDWVLSHSESEPLEVEIHEWDPISIMFTSGTTGPSKGVLNNHKAYIRCGEDSARLLELKPEDRCYIVLPLYHGNPQMMAVMSALWVGGSLAISHRFSASKFLQEARDYQATYATYVGTILAILSKLPRNQDDRDNPLRLCFGGGASKVIWKEIEERFGIKVYEAYGMIEAGCITTINRKEISRFGSVGIPRDCFEVRIVDDRDEEVGPNEVGEVTVRPLETFTMFDGYYNMPDKTLKCFRNLWFHTGDKAKKDEDGFFYFEGRLKHTIRRKGENISSEAIENAINAFPKVLESAVVGVPDEIAQEEIKAYVIPKPGMDLSPEEIISWCQKSLPEFMVPRYVEFRDRFEKTGSEKIQKYKLQEEAIGKVWDRLSK
jgi:crotonobetaine/carnitine-CoA ligase